MPLPLGPSTNTRSPAAMSKRAMSMTSRCSSFQAKRTRSISTVAAASALTLRASEIGPHVCLA